jgi:hypothetical protein
MFTITVRDAADDSEEMFEVLNVTRRFFNEPNQHGHVGEVILGYEGPGKVSYPIRHQDKQSPPHTMWVMNRYGKTVQTIQL